MGELNNKHQKMNSRKNPVNYKPKRVPDAFKLYAEGTIKSFEE